MTWWEILLIVLVGLSTLLVIGGLDVAFPVTMALCFTFGLELTLNHGDWQVVLGTGLIGAATSYAFVTLHKIAYKDMWLRG